MGCPVEGVGRPGFREEIHHWGPREGKVFMEMPPKTRQISFSFPGTAKKIERQSLGRKKEKEFCL